MKDLKLEDQGDLLPESTILLLELLLEVRLPEAYRRFLMKYNGGRPLMENTFNLKNKNNSSSVNYFFGLPTSNNENEKRYYENLAKAIGLYVYGHRLPQNLFPIASDALGNLICIATKGVDRGKIYFWDHEQELTNCDMENVSLIADSFEKFIDNLYI